MAISLGKNGSTPPIGSDIISATYVEEQELIDITNRGNAGTGVGNKVNAAGFTTETWEIETHTYPSGVNTQFTDGSWSITSVTENVSVDGAVTFSATLKKG